VETISLANGSEEEAIRNHMIKGKISRIRQSSTVKTEARGKVP